MSYENMFPLPDYDGGPADRARDRARAATNRKQDWTSVEYTVIMDEDVLHPGYSQYTLQEVIREGIRALGMSKIAQLDDLACTDGGF